jgi:hypothetical protein
MEDSLAACGENQKPIRRFGFPIPFLNQISDLKSRAETTVRFWTFATDC